MDTEARVKNDDSSSDDNDSTAAAHAAAIGHSPRSMRPLYIIPPIPGKLTKAFDSDNKASPSSPVGNGTKLAMRNDPTEEAKDVTEPSKSLFVKIDAPVGDSVAQPMAIVDDTMQTTSTDDPKNIEATKQPTIDLSKISQTVSPLKSVISPKTKILTLNPEIVINERDEDENTALHVAIHARKLTHAKLLLEAGASVRMRCDGSLPIHTAISMGGLKEHAQFAYECAVLLREHRADLTAKDDAVHTPLFLACMFNLPQIASFILSDEEGLGTLNNRADRAGNRPLHAAAKFDTSDNACFSKRAASIAMGQVDALNNIAEAAGSATTSVSTNHHQPVLRSLPASTGKAPLIAEALLTQVLLGTTGIEVDAVNVLGQSPLHTACMRRNWPVARLLLQAGASPRLADRRGFTPGQLAYKRGVPIPNDLVGTLGEPPEKGNTPPARELIVDPDASTLLLGHELCLLHHTCAPIRRDSAEPPPENVRRLQVLLDKDTGILHSGEFGRLVWNQEARRASIADVLKVCPPEALSLVHVLTNLLRFTNMYTLKK